MSGRAEEWRVGDARIVRVVENEVAIPASALFGTATLPDSAPASWLRPHYMREDGRLGFSVHAFVVDDGERRVVVDTCIGNDKHRRNPVWSGLSGTFLVRLAELGYPADSIDRVLCTHLHLDHVGWNTRLVGGEWIATFPRARYLIARDEWEHASAATPEPGEDMLGDSVRPIFAAGLADLVTTDHRVSACVSLEPTPGHTPGHVSVRIRSRGEEAVITGISFITPCRSPSRISPRAWTGTSSSRAGRGASSFRAMRTRKSSCSALTFRRPRVAGSSPMPAGADSCPKRRGARPDEDLRRPSQLAT